MNFKLNTVIIILYFVMWYLIFNLYFLLLFTQGVSNVGILELTGKDWEKKVIEDDGVTFSFSYPKGPFASLRYVKM